MKKRILYINGSFTNDSGCAVIAKNTYELLKNNDVFEAEYFGTKGLYNKQPRFAEYFPEHFNTPLKYILNQWRYYYNWTARNNIIKVLDEYKPNIAHVHSLRISSLTYSVLEPIIKRNIPIVMTLHDCFLVCPMMTLIKGDGTSCNEVLCRGKNKFHCIKNNCGNNTELSFRYAMMSFVNKMTGFDKYIAKFITPSEALKDLIIKYDNDITPNKITTINNYLSNKEFGNIQPNYENKNYFLYVGRLSKEKGIHYLLGAMKDLPKDIEIHIVGTGKEEENLKQYAKENNLDNVKFLGFKNREEIKEEYQNCIATILPCNWFENFPTTNMESFINGKPVIASNIGGIPEQVEHNKTGLLFEPANIEQLKECIMKYWNNPNLVVEHGKNAYEKAKTQYTEERYYNELMQVYNEVLNNAK